MPSRLPVDSSGLSADSLWSNSGLQPGLSLESSSGEFFGEPIEITASEADSFHGLHKSPQTTSRLPVDSQWTPSGLPADSQPTHSGLTADSQRTPSGLPSGLPGNSQPTVSGNCLYI
jgi:hypothetical protein